MPNKKSSYFLAILIIAIFLAGTEIALAQGLEGPTVNDTQVGYIDSAIPGNVLRFRSTTGYNFFRPARAEFLYARSGPQGPGLPKPERSVDIQQLSVYGECLLTERFSGFVELPVRFSNPEINVNAEGFGDMNVGFKWAFWNDCCGISSFQFRTFIPTGDAGRGLGTNHVSLEPAFLHYQKITDRLALEGEFRYWVPIGGTNFAGDLFRYGLGLHYNAYTTETVRVTPVAEFVGWTILTGQEGVVFPSGAATAEEAAGNTIFNAKLGLRVGFCNRVDLYSGYGRPLTGDRWYENVFRFEVRWLY